MEFLYNFFIYGFLGWILENVFSYAVTGHYKEEGFLIGPFKPMYAIAMAWIIQLHNAFPNKIFLLFISIVIPTTVEYTTGIIMRKYFNKDYWDYFNERYNYKGIICLRFSIAWTIISILTIEFLQPFLIIRIYSIVKPIWPILAILLIILLTFDEVYTLIKFKNQGQINLK